MARGQGEKRKAVSGSDVERRASSYRYPHRPTRAACERQQSFTRAVGQLRSAFDAGSLPSTSALSTLLLDMADAALAGDQVLLALIPATLADLRGHIPLQLPQGQFLLGYLRGAENVFAIAVGLRFESDRQQRGRHVGR